MRHLLGFIVVVVCGCSGGSDYSNVREASLAVGQAFCERRAECLGETSAGELDDCVNNFVAGICDSRDCNATPKGSSDAIDDCISALPDLSCSSDVLPAECNSIL